MFFYSFHAIVLIFFLIIKSDPFLRLLKLVLFVFVIFLFIYLFINSFIPPWVCQQLERFRTGSVNPSRHQIRSDKIADQISDFGRKYCKICVPTSLGRRTCVQRWFLVKWRDTEEAEPHKSQKASLGLGLWWIQFGSTENRPGWILQLILSVVQQSSNRMMMIMWWVNTFHQLWVCVSAEHRCSKHWVHLSSSCHLSAQNAVRSWSEMLWWRQVSGFL